MADKNDCLKCKMVNRGNFTLKEDGKVELNWLEGEKEKAKFAIHVYAIVEEVDNESWVRYVGETTNTLSLRMYQYLTGDQSTNSKVRKNIIERLTMRHKVLLLSLLDDLPVTWNGNKVNLAKGIESAMIANWLPEWNEPIKILEVNLSVEKVELIKHLY